MIKLSWSLNEPCDIVFDNKKNKFLRKQSTETRRSVVRLVSGYVFFIGVMHMFQQNFISWTRTNLVSQKRKTSHIERSVFQESVQKLLVKMLLRTIFSEVYSEIPC